MYKLRAVFFGVLILLIVLSQVSCWNTTRIARITKRSGGVGSTEKLISIVQDESIVQSKFHTSPWIVVAVPSTLFYGIGLYAVPWYSGFEEKQKAFISNTGPDGSLLETEMFEVSFDIEFKGGIPFYAGQSFKEGLSSGVVDIFKIQSGGDLRFAFLDLLPDPEGFQDSEEPQDLSPLLLDTGKIDDSVIEDIAPGANERSNLIDIIRAMRLSGGFKRLLHPNELIEVDIAKMLEAALPAEVVFSYYMEKRDMQGKIKEQARHRITTTITYDDVVFGHLRN